jgi:hypothetical protein
MTSVMCKARLDKVVFYIYIYIYMRFMSTCFSFLSFFLSFCCSVPPLISISVCGENH